MTAKNIRADGMYLDGSNPENVDPVPALNWTSKDDIKNVIVYGLRVSPAVSKLLAFLVYYKVPFTFKPGIGKKGSKYYKKMPVVDVNGRQVNDTFIIFKYLVPALAGSDAFNLDWETKIAYQYQMSTVYHLTNQEAIANFKGKGGDGPLPGFLASCILPRIRKGGLKDLKAKFDDPNALEKEVNLTVFAKEFASAMDGNNFLGGSEPNPTDVSFYGVNARYVFLKIDTIVGALDAAGLMPWFKRMEELIPLDNKPGAIYSIKKNETVTF